MILHAHTLKLLIILSAFLALSIPEASSQIYEKPVEVKFERSPGRNEVVMYCFNHSPARYSIFIEFPLLINLRVSRAYPYHFTLEPGTNRLLSVSPIEARRSIKYRFRISYRKGCVDPKPDEGFLYLLPFAEGKSSFVNTSSHMQVEDEEDKVVTSRNLFFQMEDGDTIYAARRGVVIELEQRNAFTHEVKLFFPGAPSNYIEIEHPDCTYARYSRIRQDGALVKPGDHVEAGDPIGIIRCASDGAVCDLMFQVYYTNLIPRDRFNREEKQDKSWHFIRPDFYTRDHEGSLSDGSTYESEHPLRIITQEMSRREVKRWMKKK